jgi:hypothetical protein
VNAIAQIDGNITLTTTNIPEGDNKYYTEAAVSANTAVAANTAKVGYTEVLVSANTAVAANTAKAGITTAQAATISNTTGINTGDQDLTGLQAATISNTIGINTGDQDLTGLEIRMAALEPTTSANTLKVGYTEALVSANADVVLNKLKIGQASGTTTGDMQYWNGTAWVVIATTLNEGAVLQMISGVPTWIGGTPPPAIGDLRDGGVVFWVDGNGGGLVCALSDYATPVEWGCSNLDLPSVPNVAYNGGNPVGSGAEIGDGESNTTGILADCSSAPAALAPRTFGSEWFLPSINELLEMYINKTTLEAVPEFSAFSSAYWSSSESGVNHAWLQIVSNGDQFPNNKSLAYYVRAVRAF